MEATNSSSAEQNGLYPPKPILEEPQSNNITRSITSLFIYALLFYFMFDKNIGYIAAVLLVLLVHEFGHFFAMKLYNYQNVKLFIIPLLGAYVSGKKQNVSQVQMSVIILSGPLPGLFLGFVLYFLNRQMPNENVKMLANTFIFLNLFNLLPIYPLDGGRFLENLFINNNYGIRLVFTVLSILVLLFIIIITGSLLMLIVPVMMVLELYSEIRNQKIREYLDQEKISYKEEYEALSNKNYWLIRDCILFSFRKKYAGVEPGIYQYSLLESVIIRHVMGVLKVNYCSDMSAFQKVFWLFVYIFSLLGLPLLSYIMFF